MSRPYRGRRRGTYIPPLLILIVLIAALAAGCFFSPPSHAGRGADAR